MVVAREGLRQERQFLKEASNASVRPEAQHSSQAITNVTRCRWRPSIPAPHQSPASPTSAKSLRARARGRGGLRRGGPSIDELGERQRRAQFKAARALLLCDRDGGQECVFCGRRVAGVELQEDSAARPMQFRFESSENPGGRTSPALRRGWRRRGRDRPPGLGLSQSNLQEPVEPQNVLFAQEFLLRAAYPRARRWAGRCAKPPNPAETLRMRSIGSDRSCPRGGRVRRPHPPTGTEATGAAGNAAAAGVSRGGGSTPMASSLPTRTSTSG